MGKLTNNFREDFKNPKIVEAVVSEAFNGMKTMRDLANDEDLLLSSHKRNEFLDKIRNQLAKIYVGHYMKISVPLHKYFWDKGFPFGDYEMIRQIGMARHDEYTEWVDVNDSYVPEVKSQVIDTVFKDRYTISISEAIIKAAFRGPQEMGEFMSEYMGAIDKTLSAIWFNRNIKMLQTIPIVYNINSEKKKDEKEGVFYARQLLSLIYKMGMTSTQFNVAGIPSYTRKEDLILVLNSKILNTIMIDAVGQIYNFKDIRNGGMLMEVIAHDFFDNETLGVLITRDSFKINERLDQNTQRFFADTLRQDNYKHQWLRAGRINFANGVRIVNDNSYKKEIDWQQSPFTHYEDESKRVLVKDTQKVVDVSDWVNGMNINELQIPTGIKKYLTGIKMVIGGKEKPTKEIVLDTIKQNDFRVDITLLEVEKITDDYITLKVKKPYVVNKFSDTIKIEYVLNPSIEPPKRLKSIKDDIEKDDLGKLPDNKETTILARCKEINKKVNYNEVIITNIEKTQCEIMGKKDSKYYNEDGKILKYTIDAK